MFYLGCAMGELAQFWPGFVYTSEANRTEPCQHGYDNRASVARFGTVQHGTVTFTLLSQSGPNRAGTVRARGNRQDLELFRYST